MNYASLYCGAKDLSRGKPAGQDSETSGLAEERIEVGDQVGRIPFLRADDFSRDLPVTADDVGFRIHGSAVCQPDLREVGLQDWIPIRGEFDLLIFQKFLVGCRARVGAHP